jgi:hypothetical protein
VLINLGLTVASQGLQVEHLRRVIGDITMSKYLFFTQLGLLIARKKQLARLLRTQDYTIAETLISYLQSHLLNIETAQYQRQRVVFLFVCCVPAV